MTSAPESEQPEENQKRVRGLTRIYRDFAPFLTLGFQLAAAVVLFFFIGSWIDSRYGTEPMFKLVGLFVGITGGLIKFFKTAMELGKKGNSSQS